MLRRVLTAVGLACLAVTVLAFPALAADLTPVSVPVGDYITGAAQIVGAILLPLALAGVALLPLPVQFAVKAIGGELLIRNVRDFALNAVEGAAKGKTLDVNLGKEALNVAVDRALEVGAPWLVKWLGGPEGIREKVFRALDLDETATAGALGVVLPKA